MSKIIYNLYSCLFMYFYVIQNVLSWRRWDNLTDYARYHMIIHFSQLAGIMPRFTFALHTIARDTCRSRAGTRTVIVHLCTYICPQSACQFDQNCPQITGVSIKKRPDSDKIIIRSSTMPKRHVATWVPLRRW